MARRVGRVRRVRRVRAFYSGYVMLAGCVLLIAAVLGGCGGAPEPQAVTLRVALQSEHYRLPNGLEVVLHQDRSLRNVVVDVRYHVGGKDDPPGRSGFAHLYEHMMFLGSRKISEAGFGQALDDAGALEHNAFTTEDVTEYYEVMPPSELPIALWLEADRMATPLDRVTNEAFARERDVVKNEWRERYDNRAYGHVWSIAKAAVFPEGHPYHRPAIGNPEDLDRATLEEARRFATEFYVPSNATLVVAGDIDPAEAKKLVSKYFASIPSGNPPSPRRFAFPRLASDRRIVVEADVATPRVIVAWPAPPRFSRGWDEIHFAADHISGMTAWKLRTDTKVARDVDSTIEGGRLGSMLAITVDLEPGANPNAAVDAIEARVRWTSDPDQALENWPGFVDSRTQRMTKTVLGLSSIVARAEKIQDYTEYFGNPDSAQNDLRRIQAIGAADAEAASQAFLFEPGKVVVVVKPTRGAPRSGRIAR